MAITNFIPAVWSASILEQFSANLAILPTVNRDYEGDARIGNSVKITGFNTPTITDYAGGSRSITPEALTDSTQSLLINQEKAFAFFVDDIDSTQTAGSLEPVTRDAARALAEDAESYVIAQAQANGTSVATSAITTAAHAYNSILSLRTALAKAKVPESERYVAVNPEFAALLLDSASKLSSADIAGSDAELRNGVLGRLLGFTIIETPLLVNTVSAVAKPAAIAYHKSAISFANQIQSVEGFRHTTKFADVLRGLSVYGGKVTRATGVQTHIPSA